MKRPTYAQATIEILNHLEAQGWNVRRGIKTPWAERDGVRLWFKTQGTWTGPGGTGASIGAARSLWMDRRDHASDPTDLVVEATRLLTDDSDPWGVS